MTAMTGKPETTHIIEIETGVGEPASTPLCLGQKLSPMSVGKKGMWRLDSSHMLDVHVFLYFDGKTLFVQSADDAAPAFVDGQKIGKAWAEVSAPCKIEFGGAQLRYRALAGSADTAPLARPLPLPVPPPQPPAHERPFSPGAFAPATNNDDDEATRVAPVEASPQGRSSHPPPLPTAVSPRPAAGRPVEDDLGDDVTAQRKKTPQAMRPLVNNEPELTQTRALVQVPPPPATSGASIVPAPAGSPMVPPNPPAPGYPRSGVSDPSAATRLLVVQPRIAAGGMQAQLNPGTPGNVPVPAKIVPAPVGSPMAPGAPGYPSPPAPGYPYSGASNPNVATRMLPVQPRIAAGGMQAPFNPSTPGNVPTPATSESKSKAFTADLRTKWNALPPIKKVLYLLSPFAVVASIYLLLLDDPTPQKATANSNTSSDAGATDPSTSAPPVTATPPSIPTPGTSAWPEGYPCPPPNWPPGRPLPCVPTGGIARTPPPPASAGPSDAGAPRSSGTTKDAGIDTKTASNKTLERRAVDAYAAGDFALAAEHYTELAKSDPSNPAFAEAARIARMRVNAGTP